MDLGTSVYPDDDLYAVTKASSQPTTVHVVVTCSNRKSLPIPARLRFSQVPGRSATGRAREWTTRLANTGNGPQVAAVELYAGEHWSVAREFPSLHRPGENIRLWVCSAGYGLIPAEARIMPYYATLTRGKADSVPGTAAFWWSLLSEWRGPAPKHPRSIRALVTAEPDAMFLFVLSESYLRACGSDVAAAAECIADLDRFFIVSVGSRPRGDLAAFMVPADARLQAQFGGTRRALNARIGAYLLSTGIRSKDDAVAQMARLLAAQPPIPRYDRKKQSDQEILDIIAGRLAAAPRTSASRLLRELRDAGLACEQHRFTQLYQRVKETTSLPSCSVHI
jgi:hypothetical protein